MISVQIAAVKPPHTDPTSLLSKDVKPSGAASFLDVLSGASSQSPIPPQGTAGQTAGLATQKNAPGQGQDQGQGQGEQTNAAADRSTENSQPAPNDLLAMHLTLLLTTQQTATSQSALSQIQTRIASNATNRTNDHQDKAQTADTSSTGTFLPQVDVHLAPPVTIPTLPSLASQTGGAAKAEAQSREAADAIAGAAAKNSGNPASSAAHEEKASASKTDNQESNADQNAASEQAGAAADGSSNAQIASNGFVVPSGVIFPGVELPPGSGDLNQLAGKAASSNKSSDTSSAKTPDAISGASDMTKSSDAQASASNTDNSSSTASSAASSFAVQHPQADAAQTVAANSRTTDGSATQVNSTLQAMAGHSTTHDAAATSPTAGASDGVRRADPQVVQDADETAATSGINTANVIQRMSETEMHVGMRSAEFGEVSIRTSVSQQQMLAQISVDHGDLGKAISAHIPAMEAKLGGDSGLRALVEVNQTGMSFSSERGFSSQKEQQTFAQPAQRQDTLASTETDAPVAYSAAAVSSAYRLDIRA